jgi:hypothetical protein
VPASPWTVSCSRSRCLAEVNDCGVLEAITLSKDLDGDGHHPYPPTAATVLASWTIGIICELGMATQR